MYSSLIVTYRYNANLLAKNMQIFFVVADTSFIIDIRALAIF